MIKNTVLILLFLCCVSIADGQLVEDFESFDLGPLDGQQGWTSEAGAEVFDTGIAGFGDRSIRAFNVGQNAGEYLRSPVFTSNGSGTFSFDIKIEDDDPNPRYMVSTYRVGSNTQRLNFLSDGSISLDKSAGACLTAGFLVEGNWSTGEVMRLQWSSQPNPLGGPTALHEIRLNNSVIFAGTNSLGCGSGTFIDSFGVSSTGGLQADVTIDNVHFEPLLILGDINNDFNVNLFDVNPFVNLLANGGFVPQADINGDGNLNLLDVPGFVELLSN